MAVQRENEIRFLTTLAITNGMISAANGIISAILRSNGDSSQNGSSGNAFGKTMDALKKFLMPGAIDQDQEQIRKVKAIMEREMDKPFEIRPMARPTKKRKVQRRPGQKR